jgi:hypothetical protein
MYRYPLEYHGKVVYIEAVLDPAVMASLAVVVGFHKDSDVHSFACMLGSYPLRVVVVFLSKLIAVDSDIHS